MPLPQLSGVTPSSKVAYSGDSTIIGEVVLNPDGSLVGGGGGGGTVIVQPTVTSHFVELGASASQDIPIGAKGWTVGFLTGTGTIGGVVAKSGFADGDPYTTAATITVTTDADSSAYIRYN